MERQRAKPILIEGRRIYWVKSSKSQTINVCRTQVRGEYEVAYRLPADVPVTEADLRAQPTLAALRAWLENKGDVELPGATATPKQAIKEVTDRGIDPDWMTAARRAVERCLDDLVKSFLTEPYLHRVEHSLHAELFGRLMSKRVLRDTTALQGGARTGLVHKEWPERWPRVKGHPRGLFDLAVLAPSQVARADRDQFRNGRIAAPIVIEVGLDYPFKHLDQDRHKLQQSKVAAGYLLHLSRIPAKDRAKTETLILGLPADGIRTAYAHVEPGLPRRLKLINDEQISEL